MCALLLYLAVGGCGDCHGPETTAPAPSASAPAPSPDASASASAEPEPEVMPEPRCPPDMVEVAATQPAGDAGLPAPFCIDRYEAMLVDAETAARIPPYYAPSRRAAQQTAKMWEQLRFQMGGPQAQAEPLPTLPAWMLARDFEPKAVARKAVRPNGHTSGEQAIVACRHAGKRLCRGDEWRIACGGEQGWQFPYGADYEQGGCNVFREAHPAMELHDDPSIGHSDPRLNRVTVKGKPLLRKTGETARCASRWGEDAVYDMVGNVDEWIDDPEGTFAGGFYARATKDGCEWFGRAHPIHYADYSTGVRCCADLPR